MNYWTYFRGKMQLRRGMTVEAQLFNGSTQTKVCEILYKKGNRWVAWCEEDDTEYLVDCLTIKRVYIDDLYRKQAKNEHDEYKRQWSKVNYKARKKKRKNK